MSWRARPDYSRAGIASVALHVGVIVVLMLSRMWAKELPIGSVVPITIVPNANVTDLRAAQQADVAQTAQAEAPEPQVEPTPPQPTPPTPVPTPKPAEAKPVPDKGLKPPAKPEKALDLDALLASVKKAAPKNALRGPNRAETAWQAREAAGAGQAEMAAAMNGLANELQRRWNPNCEVEGGRDVKVRVTFTLGSGGQVVGVVQAGGQENSANPVVKAAAERAIRAVHQAAPFSTLPHGFFGQAVTVNFNAREACA